MQWLKENIFFRLLVPLVTGICVATFLDCNNYYVSILLLIHVLVYGIISRIKIEKQRRFSLLKGITLQIILLLLSILLLNSYNESLNPKHFSKFLDNTKVLIARVSEDPLKRNKVIKVSAKIFAYYDTAYKYSFGNTTLYLSISNKSEKLKYGDIIVFNNLLQNIKRDRNPHAIDYQFTNRNKNIFQTAFLKDKDWKVLSPTNRFDVYSFALNLRNSCLKIINSFIDDKNNAAVSASLLLGYRTDLDFELENAYARAGVVHILAVSGMHVGLIFFLLNYLLSWMDKVKKLAIAKTTLLIASIFFFSLITGLAGSVLRAAVMLSVFLIGKHFKYYLSQLNILFASAFLILIFKPTILFDVGFELSFSAVWGILTFQKIIFELISTPNKILNYFLNISSVSLAAQTGTIPLILYYFHQFPIHFIIANIFVIPIASIIIYSTILLVCIFPLVNTSLLLGQIINKLIVVMNEIVVFIQSLPFALFHFRHFELEFMILSLIAMLFMLNFLNTRRYRYLNLSLVTISMIVIISTYYSYRDLNTKNIVVFEHSKYLVSNFRNGDEAVLIYSKDADFTSGAFDKYIIQYYRREGVNTIKKILYENLSDNQQLFKWIKIDGNRIKYMGTDVAIGKYNLEITNQDQTKTVIYVRENKYIDKRNDNFILSNNGPFTLAL